MKKLILILLLISATFLSACGTRESGLSIGKETTASGVESVENISDIVDGGIYVYHDGKYLDLYVHNANFPIEPNSSSNSSRTLWFKDDFDKIPTMYTGDELVYKTSSSLNERFSMERFAYVGYTVGITGLSRLESGRYSFSADPENRNINYDSDARQLVKIKTKLGIIDKIGGAYLRSGNISLGGCILGLEKDKVYSAEVYAGTYLNTINLTADCIAMTSMEYYSTLDYDFLQSEILRINIPDYFNSGYYMINGYGLVRIVNGTEYDADTNFNIPNVKPTGDDFYSRFKAIEEDQLNNPDHDPLIGAVTSDKLYETIEFEVDATSTVIISVEYSASQKLSSGIPKVVLYGEDAYQNELGLVSTQKLMISDILGPGKYTLELNEMSGRQFIYKIEMSGAPYGR